MNITVGTSKTVHNAGARSGSTGQARPTCSVSTNGKTVTETDAAVTCKTCAKAAKPAAGVRQ